MPGLSRREALSYLSSRLTDHPDQRIEALDLGEDLDGLPLALGQATAVINARQQGCREYRAALAGRRQHMAGVDGASATVLATWSLAAECAHELPPSGLAWPTLVLAAMMDPHGIPGAVLTSPAACSYITGRPSTAGGADQNMVRAAINNLAALGLVTVDPVSPVRTVQLHDSVQAAVRAWLPQADLEQVVLAAADALLETWPEDSGGPHLDQALRDCAAALRANDGGMLWKAEAHPLLFRAGLSLENSRLSDASIAYWQSMLATSTRLLGPAHANAVVARDRLAAAYESAGRSADAISVFQAALTDRERNQGPEHPETIAARGHLAHAYQSAGRPAEAVALYERTAADSERLLGSGHAVTWQSRASLADAYQKAGQPREAISGYEVLLSEAERVLGAGHPTTLSARASLAGAYAASGQHRPAIEQYERALTDQERMHGHDHPDAIAARASLASAYRSAGKLKDAIGQYERVLADRERVEGADHPDTIASRANLAFAYRSAGTPPGGDPAVRAHARRPGTGAGSRPPGHAHRALEPGRLLPAGAPAARRDPAVRAGAGRQRADARGRRHGDADHPVQPRLRVLHRGPPGGRRVGPAARPDRLRTLPGTRPSDDPDRARKPGRRHPGVISLKGASRAPGERKGVQRQMGTYDFVIVGGGSAGSALANRLSADPAARVLVLEAGRPDYIWDPYIHMPAALTFPIGNRFYDWKYSSEPEPHLNGRRVYHARGKVLGGSSSINGMIFQRGNPHGLRALGRRPGDGRLGLRALPALLQADGDVPGRGRHRSVPRAATGRWCSSAAPRPARCSVPSSPPCSRPGTRSPTT